MLCINIPNQTLTVQPIWFGLRNVNGNRQPHLHFSHLFNAYSKYFNTRYNRHGSLFETPFKRKLINNEVYLKQIVHYIHFNPVKHGFCEHPLEYPWSSYIGFISVQPTMLFLKRESVLQWFENDDNFKYLHDSSMETKWMEDWLEI
jgi:hypothetical protein